MIIRIAISNERFISNNLFLLFSGKEHILHKTWKLFLETHCQYTLSFELAGNLLGIP